MFTIKFLFEVSKKRVDVLLLSLTNSYNTIILSEWSGGGGAADLIVRLPHYYQNIFIGWHCYENKEKIISL